MTTTRPATRVLSVLAAVGGLLGITAAPAQATNGYFSHGYGPEAKALAGAGTAHGSSPLAPATNPALAINTGNKAGLCLTHFRPDRDATIGGTKYDSGSNGFNLACGGVNFSLDDGNAALGLVVYGNGGMNTDYGVIPQFGTTPLGVDLAQMFIGVNYAHRLDDKVSVGIMPVLAMQRFKATGLENFQAASMFPNDVTNRGYDYSFGGGVRVGILADVTPWLSLGASYQSKMAMEPFEKYRGLFADQGDFDIPATARVGAAIRPFDDWTFMVDAEHIFYGDVDAIANIGNAPNCFPLGGANGCGFGWNDMNVFRLAAEWQATDSLVLRTGYSWATDFTDDSEVSFNVLAPATIRNHASAGFSYRINENWGLTGAYTRAFEAEKSGTLRPMMGGAPAKLRMDQHEVSMGVSYRW